MSPCPLCGEAGGFHGYDCGHLAIPDDWVKLQQGQDNRDTITATWMGYDGGLHTTTYALGHEIQRGATPPAWLS